MVQNLWLFFVWMWSCVMMTLDASPWGVGFPCGCCRHHRMVLSAFTAQDAGWLKTIWGDSECQQIAEALAVLIAERAWTQYWQDLALVLAVRSDSVTALHLLCRVTSSGFGTNRIAPELATTLCESAVRPHLFRRSTTSGQNCVADVLNRRHEPSRVSVVPGCLAEASETQVPPRTKALWKTL